MKIQPLPAIAAIVDHKARIEMIEHAADYWFEADLYGLGMIETTRQSAEMLSHKLEVSFEWLYGDSSRASLLILYVNR